MKTFKEFVYTKDGVRKQVKNEDEASNVRDSYHNPKKHPSYVKPATARKNAAIPIDHNKIAIHAEMTIGDHTPDADGHDVIHHKVAKMYPHLTHDQVNHHINLAVKKHLGSDDYMDHVMKTAGHYHRHNP
jgi:hypothetical protein